MGYSCSIPKDAVLPEIDYGFFRLAVTIDTGPFGGLVQGSREFVLRR